MAQNSPKSIVGLVATIIGAMLTMGGLMWVLAMSFPSDLPWVVVAPGAVQAGLGLAAVAGGFLLYRGYAAAKYLLIAVVAGVVANCVFLAWVMATSAARG